MPEGKARLIVQGVRAAGDGGAFERRPDAEPTRGAPELRPHRDGQIPPMPEEPSSFSAGGQERPSGK
jgi:hypothetical protein